MRLFRSDRFGKLLGVFAVMALSMVALLAGIAPPAQNWTTPPSRDFPLAGGNYWHQRYSSLDEIDTSNVKNLGGAWHLHLTDGGLAGQLQGTPVVVDGVMYVATGMRELLAIDAKTGAVRWRYRPDSKGAAGANRGVVAAEGKVFFGRRDNVLVALDQQTGQVIWETQVTSERTSYVSAPTVYYDGLVYVGTSGGDAGARGQLGAYDAKTGSEVWKFYTIPDADDRFADTWEGDSYKSGGGGIWTTPTLDPELGLIYVSVGNAGLKQYRAAVNNPSFRDEGERAGDNLFTASVLALDLKTGEYKWHFQEVHHDIWHLDAGGASVLADIIYRGQLRKILMNPGKTGFLYILDRTNGKPLIGIEERPVPQEPRLKTAPTQPFPIGDPFAPSCPEPLDTYEFGCLFSPFWETPVLISHSGNTWAPMTYSPKTKLAYVPASIRAFVHQVREDGATTADVPPGSERAGTLTAMDPVTNKIVWQKKTKYPMGGGSGLLSTAGGLIFRGAPDGNLMAYDISNGDELWMFQTGAGADAPVSTYEVEGEQYVAIVSGGNGILLSQRGDSVWAFKLGGTVPEAAAPRKPPLLQPGRTDR